MDQPQNTPDSTQGGPDDGTTFTVARLLASARRLSWKVMVPLCAMIAALLAAGYHYHWDAKVVGGGVFLLALLSNLFGWLLALVGMVPVVGPLVVQFVGLPVMWLLNSLGSLVSFVAVRRGYSRDVLTYRGLTIALIAGVVIGFVMGKLL